MLTNYKSQCESKVKETVKELVKTATCNVVIPDWKDYGDIVKDGDRLVENQISNLSLENYQEFIAECKVEVSHALNAEYDESKVTGSTDKQGEAVSSQEEYQKAIERHLTDELNNPKNLELLLNKIKQSECAKYTQKSTLATTSTILYEHTCPTCKGDSEQQCTECRGQGEIRCGRCAGKGEYRCVDCGGRGEKKCSKCKGKGRCERCDGRGRIKYRNSDNYYECDRCKGSGKCYECNGKGTQWCSCAGGFKNCYECRGAGFIECPNCDGTTIAKCKTCNGTNKIIEIAQIQLSTTPKYTQSYADNVDELVKQAFEKHNIEAIANVTRTELRLDESQKRIVETYQAQIPFAKFNVSFSGKKFAWLVYGKNLNVQGEQGEMLQLAINELQKIAEKLSTKDTIWGLVVLIGLCYGIYRLVKWLFF